MLNLKKSQEIKDKEGYSYIVLAIIDGAVFLFNTMTCQNYWYTDSEIEASFILPKEKWVPKEGEVYYTPDMSSCGAYYNSFTWFGDFVDKSRLSNSLVFQTEAEAQNVVEEIKKLLNN
jgi:hypothetical protein